MGRPSSRPGLGKRSARFRWKRWLLFALLVGFAPGLAEARTRYEEHVVALSVTYQAWDEDRPWAKMNPATRNASAVVIAGPFLLTRAQIVANATLIQAERRGDAQTWTARVVHIDPEIDLALIQVDEAAFFEGLRPVKIAKRIPTEGSVTSVRWNARQLEISESRVSTIEVGLNRYGNVEHAFLEVRTDFASGGWAEPSFDGAKLVGLTSSQEDQRARIVPAEVLRDYVERVAEGSSTSVPRLDLLWQNNQDPSLTRYLGFEEEPRGILIREVRGSGTACSVLESRDILLELDGHEIDSIGNYLHPRYGNLRFTNLVAHRRPGEVIAARVFRDGREQEVEFELKAYPSQLRRVPWRRDNSPPPYLVAGGLVFRELDGEFLRTWGSEWASNAPRNLAIQYYLYGHSTRPDQRRAIVLSSVLPDRYNIGYHDVADMITTHVNGIPIDSVDDLVSAFAQPQTDANGEPAYHVVRFAPNSYLAELVLDARTFEEASARIADAYGLPATVRTGPPEEPDIAFDCEAP